jgi:hypothetical protein
VVSPDSQVNFQQTPISKGAKRMAKNNLKADVVETKEDSVRTITIIITGDADDFQFADMLARRKIIQPIANVVKQAALDGTSRYLESAETVISGVKKETAGSDETVPKRGSKGKDKAPPKEVSVHTGSGNLGKGNGVAASLSGD